MPVYPTSLSILRGERGEEREYISLLFFITIMVLSAYLSPLTSLLSPPYTTKLA